MDFRISLAFHIVGIAMWAGGLMILSRFFKLFNESSGGNAALAALIRRVFYGYIVSGFVIALLSGLYQLSYRGAAFYMSQGWFHGKLTFVVILLVATALAFVDVRGIGSGRTVSKARAGAIHGLVGLALIGAVFFTLLGTPSIQ